jgi:hypothetical protein
MQFIGEEIIDQYIQRYESESAYLEDFGLMLEEQLDVQAYIDHENYSLLKNEEIALMEYLSTIIYFSSKEVIGAIPKLYGNTLENFEEKNWDVFNEGNSKNFSSVLDKFFEGYEQEDLLALVEDSIVPDDENLVTSVGSEIICVACKSIIDSLHHLN